MLGLFNRKRREQEQASFLESSFMAMRQGEVFKALKRLLDLDDMKLESDPDEIRLVGCASAFITSKIMKISRLPDRLDEGQTYVAMIVLFVACDHLSKSTGVAFEQSTAAAPLFLFGAKANLPPSILKSVGTDFNRLIVSPKYRPLITTIGLAIAAYVSHPIDACLQPAATTMRQLDSMLRA